MRTPPSEIRNFFTDCLLFIQIFFIFATYFTRELFLSIIYTTLKK